MRSKTKRQQREAELLSDQIARFLRRRSRSLVCRCAYDIFRDAGDLIWEKTPKPKPRGRAALFSQRALKESTRQFNEDWASGKILRRLARRRKVR
jgi:hypothetical protein